ncbi:MAG: nuclear transport factor 2 family protein [Thermomicrobiales bacterium]
MSSTIPDTQAQNLATARRYFAAIEQRADVSVIAACLHPAIVQEEFPNRLNPHGGRSDLDTMLARMAQGRQLLTAERYEIVSELAAHDRVALEVLWSGTLAIPLGDQLPAGSTMRARFGLFLDFQDGRIIAQRNYDCFEPW